MKTKTTVILLIALIALGAYVYFYEIKGGEARKKEKEAAAQLVSFKTDSVKQVTLIRPSGNFHFQAVRQDEEWKIVQPVQSEGDKFAIEGLINAVVNSRVERVVAEDTSDLKDFGLKPPQALVILQEKSGKKDTIAVGNKNPTDTFLYIHRDHLPKVELTSTSLSYQITKGLFDFRDKTVLPFDKGKVVKVEIWGPTSHFVIEKSGDDWFLKSPVHKKADKTEVEKILNRVRGARASAFVAEKAENLRKYGLKPPKYKVTFTLEPNKAEKTLLIGKKKDDDHYYAKDASRNPIMSISSSVVDVLGPTTFDLRDKTVLAFKRNDISRIELVYPDSTIICEKDTANNWKITFPDSAKAKSWKISSLLTAMTGLKAKEFLPGTKSMFARAGLKNPKLLVRLYDKDKHFVESLSIGKNYDDQKTYVTNHKKEEVFGVASKDLNNIKVKLKDLKSD